MSGFHKYWGKKPVEAWRFPIQNFTDQNDIVLDPFLGSGLIARECVDIDRRFIGFDVNPISIELTKLYLELPSYSEMDNAMNDLADKSSSTINLMYSLPDGRRVSHFLWENDRITNVWMKNGNRRTEIELSEDEIEVFQNSNLYIPKNMRRMSLFDNSRINSKQSFSLNDLFTPKGFVCN